MRGRRDAKNPLDEFERRTRKAPTTNFRFALRKLGMRDVAYVTMTTQLGRNRIVLQPGTVPVLRRRDLRRSDDGCYATHASPQLLCASAVTGILNRRPSLAKRARPSRRSPRG